MANRRQRSEFSTEAAWGKAVRAWLPSRCAVCWSPRLDELQADHIIPRSQGGRNDLHNGWLICGDRGCRFHARLTAYEAQIDPTLLTVEHLAYLAAEGYVRFDEAGEPSGRGFRRFLPRTRQTFNARLV